jgi:hypothetical protein
MAMDHEHFSLSGYSTDSEDDLEVGSFEMDPFKKALQEEWDSLLELTPNNHLRTFFDDDYDIYKRVSNSLTEGSKKGCQETVKNYLSSMKKKMTFKPWFQKWIVPKHPKGHLVVTRLGPVENWLYSTLVTLCVPQDNKYTSQYTGSYDYVFQFDIANFYNGIYVHRLIHALERSSHADTMYIHLLGDFLALLSKRQSYGIPIGPPASGVLASFFLSVLKEEFQKYANILQCHVSVLSDTFTVYCPTKNSAYQMYEYVVGYLTKDQNLTLQVDRTRIVTSSEFKKLLTERDFQNYNIQQFFEDETKHSNILSILNTMDHDDARAMIQKMYQHPKFLDIISKVESEGLIGIILEFILIDPMNSKYNQTVNFLENVAVNGGFEYNRSLALHRAETNCITIKCDQPPRQLTMLPIDLTKKPFSYRHEYASWDDWTKMIYLISIIGEEDTHQFKAPLHPNERLLVNAGSVESLCVSEEIVEKNQSDLDVLERLRITEEKVNALMKKTDKATTSNILEMHGADGSLGSNLHVAKRTSDVFRFGCTSNHGSTATCTRIKGFGY